MKTDTHNPSELFAEQWKVPWHLMDVVLGGKSSIDLNSFHVHDKASADLFLKSYGYNLDLAEDQKSCHSLFIEAIHFMESVLMPKEWRSGNRPPHRFIHCKDLRQLLIWASMSQGVRSKEHKHLQLWSCATLKLMHTISHLDNPERTSHLKEAREQILSRFQPSLFRDTEENLCFGSPENHVVLMQLDWKMHKERNSILLKLLHKPANVAETIFDHIGVRFVTHTQADTIQLLSLLRQNHIIDFANLHPTRTRNTLIKVEHFQKNISQITQKVSGGKMSVEEGRSKIVELHLFPEHHTKQNPHSSKKFRSIQLTCRQRVLFQRPEKDLYARMTKAVTDSTLATQDKKRMHQAIKFLTAQLEDGCMQQDSIFFPFEVQIIDGQTFRQTQTGEACHDKYKAAQIRTARKRILGKILDI
ncbi:MAG: TIGR04552 family protein [Zetaproteobacteria bacterium]|nr:TIGR04552 family protein [Zetaproteobacteria bacterium]